MSDTNHRLLILVILTVATCISVFTPASAVDWEYIDPLNIGREAPAAALASDGKVYVTGGRSADETVLASIEVYDPVRGVWTHGTPMVQGRWRHETVAMGDLIYAVGGGDLTGAFDTVELYDVTGQTWATAAHRLNVPRSDFGLTVGGDGKLYAIGGGSGQPAPMSSVEVFDPSNPDAGWQLLVHELNEPRLWLGAGTDALGRVYAIGGATGGSNSETTTVERFDPSDPDAGWQYAPSLNEDRQVGAYVSSEEGQIFVLGGWAGGSGPFRSSVEVYDPVADKWSIHSDLGRPVNNFTAAIDPWARVYAIGGEHGSGTALADVQRIPEPLTLSVLLVGAAGLLTARARTSYPTRSTW